MKEKSVSRRKAEQRVGQKAVQNLGRGRAGLGTTVQDRTEQRQGRAGQIRLEQSRAE